MLRWRNCYLFQAKKRLLQTLSRAAVKKKKKIVVTSPYTCFMFTFLYFLLYQEHLFTSPVQVKNAFYCHPLCGNLPQVFMDVLRSSLGVSALCLLSCCVFRFIPVAFCIFGVPARQQHAWGAPAAHSVAVPRRWVCVVPSPWLRDLGLLLAASAGLHLPCLQLEKSQRSVWAGGGTRHGVQSAQLNHFVRAPVRCWPGCRRLFVSTPAVNNSAWWEQGTADPSLPFFARHFVMFWSFC